MAEEDKAAIRTCATLQMSMHKLELEFEVVRASVGSAENSTAAGSSGEGTAADHQPTRAGYGEGWDQ